MVEDGDGVRPKKGKKTWKPAQRLSVVKKQPGLRYRWCDKDPDNLYRKQVEGWQFADRMKGVVAEHERPEHVRDGQPLQGAKEYRDLALMVLDEETGQARDRYFEELTNRRTLGMKDTLKGDLADKARETGAPPAPVHGKIVID